MGQNAGLLRSILDVGQRPALPLLQPLALVLCLQQELFRPLEGPPDRE